MNRTSFCNKTKQDYCVNNNSNNATRNNMAQKYYGFKVNSYMGSSRGTIGSYDYKNRNDGEVEDLMGSGFPWPPRNYTCSFCKREFRSAQALGGHMNVHRRDRARLRQYSPPSGAFGDYDNNGNCNNNYNSDGLQVSSMNLSSASILNPSLNSNPTSNNRFLGNSRSHFSSSSTTALFASSLPLISCPLSDGRSKIKKTGSGDKDVCGEGFRMMTEDLIQMKASTKGIYEEDHRKSYMHDKECDQKRDFVSLDLEIGLASRDDHRCKEEMELDLELRLGYY